MKHVVVIGSGFAGLMALKQLTNSKNLKITLINKGSYFLFTPRLTELLNESVNKIIVIKDIKKIFGNKINFINDTAKYIDFNKKIVKTGKSNVINYDYLIMAQGATTNFFGNKSIEDNSLDYKSYNSVLKIKNKIKNNVKKYTKENKEFLTFAVIGGGLTGIELICSLRETVLKEIKKYPNIKPKHARFILVQGEKTIAPQLPQKVRSIIENYLSKNNIETITSTRAKAVKNNTIICEDKNIKAAAVIWTAGIKANTINAYPKLKLDKGSSIKVNSKLKILDHDDVYVAGDAAIYVENNKSIEHTAQVAWMEGIHIGRNILRRVNGKKEKDFHYYHKGTLIVLGSTYGIFSYNNINIKGRVAWYLRDSIYKYRFSQIT